MNNIILWMFLIIVPTFCFSYENNTSKIEDNSSVNTEKNIQKVKIIKRAIRNIPAVMIKEDHKVFLFLDTKLFKESKVLSKLKLSDKIKSRNVAILLLRQGGKAIYSQLQGDDSYQDTSNSLMEEGFKIAVVKGGGQLIKRVVCIFLPPPSNAIAIVTLAGEEIIKYSIDKYIELDKRNYVDLEDMLWAVPNEIKNKITILNFEDTKNKTVFDFSDIDQLTILNDEVKSSSILDTQQSNKNTILDY